MKYNDIGQKVTIERTDKLISEAASDKYKVQVFRDIDGKYSVVVNDLMRHPNGDAESALRAIGGYLASALYREEGLSKTLAETVTKNGLSGL